MSEGEVNPPTMVVAEAHNIGEVERRWTEQSDTDPEFRYLPCSQENV